MCNKFAIQLYHKGLCINIWCTQTREEKSEVGKKEKWVCHR